MVSISSASAPAAASDRACAANAAVNSSALTSPETSILPAGPIDAKTSARVPAAFFEIATAGAIDGIQIGCGTIVHGNRIRPKTVGQNHLAARLHIRARHPLHLIGMRQVPRVGIRADRAIPAPAIAFPTRPSLISTPPLNHFSRPCIWISVLFRPAALLRTASVYIGQQSAVSWFAVRRFIVHSCGSDTASRNATGSNYEL